MKLKPIIALVGLAFLALFLLPVYFFLPWTTKLQTLTSPDGRHRVELLRVDGIDRIYYVNVNGSRIYGSPDFAPNQKIPFRESLTWDKTGRVVILEIARHRIFGYDVEERRKLTEDELLAAELTDPPLWEYGFESEWPGVGRARQPDE